MRIAAGILLLVVSLGHSCSGAGLIMLGSCSASIGAAVDTISDHSKETREATKGLEMTGGILMTVGSLLIVLVGLQIAAAVQLFRRRSPVFVMVTGALGLLIGAGSIVLLALDKKNPPGAGSLIFLGLGLVASALAIVAANQVLRAPPDGMAPS